MFHVKHIPLLILLFISMNSLGQSYFSLPERTFNPTVYREQDIIKQLHRETRFKMLLPEEQEFYYWVNLLRKSPSRFFTVAVKPFLDTFPELKGKESRSLEHDLIRAEPMPLLLYSKVLYEAAMDHATDLANKANRLSHESSNGMSFSMRMKTNGINKCAAENLYQGENRPFFALMMLLLDMGMEVPGHRKNLLNPNYKLMGVAVQKHKGGSYHLLVQDFSCL